MAERRFLVVVEGRVVSVESLHPAGQPTKLYAADGTLQRPPHSIGPEVPDGTCLLDVLERPHGIPDGEDGPVRRTLWQLPDLARPPRPPLRLLEAPEPGPSEHHPSRRSP